MRASQRRRNRAMGRNTPTPEGIVAGAALARLYERARADAAVRAPEALAAVGDPCQSCAYRAGTFPNGCPETVMDATKCAIEGVPFLCHQTRGADGKHDKLCAGWLVTQRAGQPPGRAPWNWTA